MTILSDSFASIIQLLLVSENQGAQPPSVPWPIYVSRMPDGNQVEAELITVYDTEPRQDGRLMAGERIEHPGFQVRVRALDYETGHRKMSEIAAVLDNVKRQTVVGDVATYEIQAITRSSGSISIGTDDEGREGFTLNATATVAENP